MTMRVTGVSPHRAASVTVWRRKRASGARFFPGSTMVRFYAERGYFRPLGVFHRGSRWARTMSAMSPMWAQ